MANNYILFEKYVPKIKGENSWATTSPINGGLYLVEEGVVFVPDNTVLSSFSNLLSFKDRNNTAFAFNEISKAEIGSFKHLWKMIYTLRICLKNGEKHFFLMSGKQVADKWTCAINRRLG